MRLITAAVVLSLLSSAAAQTKTPRPAQAKEEAQKNQQEKAAAAKPEQKKDENPAAESSKPDQPEGAEARRPRDPMSAPTFTGLKMRLIGPAVISGRVV